MAQHTVLFPLTSHLLPPTPRALQSRAKHHGFYKKSPHLDFADRIGRCPAGLWRPQGATCPGFLASSELVRPSSQQQQQQKAAALPTAQPAKKPPPPQQQQPRQVAQQPARAPRPPRVVSAPASGPAFRPAEQQQQQQRDRLGVRVQPAGGSGSGSGAKQRPPLAFPDGVRPEELRLCRTWEAHGYCDAPGCVFAHSQVGRLNQERWEQGAAQGIGGGDCEIRQPVHNEASKLALIRVWSCTLVFVLQEELEQREDEYREEHKNLQFVPEHLFLCCGRSWSSGMTSLGRAANSVFIILTSTNMSHLLVPTGGAGAAGGRVLRGAMKKHSSILVYRTFPCGLLPTGGAGAGGGRVQGGAAPAQAGAAAGAGGAAVSRGGYLAGSAAVSSRGRSALYKRRPVVAGVGLACWGRWGCV